MVIDDVKLLLALPARRARTSNSCPTKGGSSSAESGALRAQTASRHYWTPGCAAEARCVREWQDLMCSFSHIVAVAATRRRPPPRRHNTPPAVALCTVESPRAALRASVWTFLCFPTSHLRCPIGGGFGGSVITCGIRTQGGGMCSGRPVHCPKPKFEAQSAGVAGDP